MASVSDLEGQLHDERRPGPGRLSTRTAPPSCSTIPRTMKSPSPKPVAVTDHRPALEGLEDPLLQIRLDPQSLIGHRQPGDARAARSAPARMTTGRPCPYLTALANRFETT